MRLDWKGALGFAVSALLLWWTLRGIHFAEVWQALRGSSLVLWGACMVASQLIFPLRAVRWRAILDPVHPRLPVGPLWRATAIGMMVNNVVPARAGEFARAFALTRERRDVTFPTAATSLAVDRVFDALCTILLFVLAMLDPAIPAGITIAGRTLQQMAVLGLGLVAALFAALLLVARFPYQVELLVARTAGRLLPRLAPTLGRLVHQVAEGLAVLHEPRRFVVVFLWALVHWLMNAFAFWLGFEAIGIEAPLSAALFTQGLIVIGVSIPSSPGFFGVFEAFAKIALPIYGVSEQQAVTWAIGFHVLSFIPITVIGIVYFGRLGMHLADLGQAKAGAPSPPGAPRA